MSKILDDLSVDLKSGRAIIVAGAGVSISASGGAPTSSWAGLVRDGARLAVEVNGSLPENWLAGVQADLDMAATYSPAMLAAADKVAVALDAPGGHEYARWLKSGVGELSLVDSTLIDAIVGLNCPIATTNYDDLIEVSSGRFGVTWRDAGRMQQALMGATNEVAHLHGSWRDPDSVILSASAYGSVMADAAAQALQRGAATMSSLVIVGAGQGMDDPNFSLLRSWLASTLPKSQVRHYRLCLESELADLRAEFAGESLVPVAFGDSHAELPAFLSRLAQTSAVEVAARVVFHSSPDAPQLGLSAIYDRIRSDLILAEHVDDIDSRQLEELLIAPVLLPVTHEQFVKSMDLDRENRPQRCDPVADAETEEAILVAGEENSGLTSALTWLVGRRHILHRQAIPIHIDFKSLGAGRYPLKRQILRELRQSGISIGPDDVLPAIALAVDNLSAKPTKIFDRVVTELINNPPSLLVLGCRIGTEGELLERLASAGVQPSLRYLGRLGERDVRNLATLVAPRRANEVAARAVAIANREHLTRTPFTFSLLISALLHGEALLATASETALLDAYVQLLMGRGDPHDDARFSLDARERADILATVAENMVLSDTGSLSEAAVLEALQHYFDAVDWNEDPLDVLDNLRRRHLMVMTGGKVRFAQASYLHLFAAKRAIDSETFQGVLFGNPLYYAPIIQHYAALTRNDEEVLEAVAGLLAGRNLTAGSERSSLFSAASAEAITATKTIDELVLQLGLPDVPKPQPVGEEDPSNGDWLDFHADEDQSPFPLDRIEEAPAPVQVLAVLALVSNVLRDSELVRNSELKEAILKRTLILWGHFVVLLEKDEDYNRFLEAVGSAFAEMLGLSDSRRERLVQRFVEDGPLLTAIGGMGSTLSSRKLARSLERCYTDPEFSADAIPAVMGAFLALLIQESGWAALLARVGQQHEHVVAVRTVLRQVAELAYYHQSLSRSDEDALRSFLVDQYMLELTHEPAQRSATEARVSQSLQLKRRRFQPMRLPAGQTVFTASESPSATDRSEIEAADAEGQPDDVL